MAAAAAASGNRRRRFHQRNLEAKQQRALAVKTKRAELARNVFDDLSSDDGLTIPKSLLEELLSRVINVDKEKLNNDAVQLVLDTEQGKRENKGGDDKNQCKTSNEKGVLHRNALLCSYERYNDYMKALPVIDEIFAKYDKNRDGFLSGKEFMNMLQVRERDDKAHDPRVRKGLMVDVIVLYEDVESIMQQIDLDRDGMVGRHEVIPAFDAWDIIVAKKLTKKSECCTIS
jgi:Ca2+-binding EF-hand superfamily protein